LGKVVIQALDLGKGSGGEEEKQYGKAGSHLVNVLLVYIYLFYQSVFFVLSIYSFIILVHHVLPLGSAIIHISFSAEPPVLVTLWRRPENMVRNLNIQIVD